MNQPDGSRRSGSEGEHRRNSSISRAKSGSYKTNIKERNLKKKKNKNMKKVLFVINTLGGAGAERALLELLKRFTPDQYEVDLYILLEQGELISQVPEYVNILNRNYTAKSVLSAEGKKKLNKKRKNWQLRKAIWRSSMI